MKKDRLKVLLAIYDEGSYVPWFPTGLGYVAAVLKQEGYDIDVYNQDIGHYPDDALRDYLDNNRYDAVCISVIGGYWQYQRLLGLSKAIAGSKNRPGLYVIGGYGPTPEVEYFLKKTGADVCVMGEGEDTTRELFKAYENGDSYEGIAGIAYREGDVVKRNPPRPLISEEFIDDTSRIPIPAYDLFAMENYRLLRMPHAGTNDFAHPMLSGRGCTFKCNFCYRMDTGFRARSPEGILEEVEQLQKDWGITYIAFSDDLLMVNKPRTIELAEAFIRYQEKTGRKFKWDCNGRLNYCTPEILNLMKRAGAVYINYGIEAFDNQALKDMKKGLNTDMIVKGVEQTLACDITPGLNIIWGNLGEDPETLKKGVAFLKKYNRLEMRSIRPVTPYPGSPLYFEAIRRGLIDKDNPAEDFYERKHLNSDLFAVNFMDISEQEAYKWLQWANEQLVEDYFDKQKASYLEQVENLYGTKDTSFRGYRSG